MGLQELNLASEYEASFRLQTRLVFIVFNLLRILNLMLHLLLRLLSSKTIQAAIKVTVIMSILANIVAFSHVNYRLSADAANCRVAMVSFPLKIAKLK